MEICFVVNFLLPKFHLEWEESVFPSVYYGNRGNIQTQAKVEIMSKKGERKKCYGNYVFSVTFIVCNYHLYVKCTPR